MTTHSHARNPYSQTMMADEEAALLAQLRAQVEFYMSPQNLAKDTYLRSILQGNDNAVLVETIANFPKVKELHAVGRLGMNGATLTRDRMPPADPVFLCRALEQSHVVTVSNDFRWIRLAAVAQAVPQEQTGTHSGGGTFVDPRPHERGKDGTSVSNQDSATATSTHPGSSPADKNVTSIKSAPSSPSSQTTAASSAGVPTHPIPTTSAPKAHQHRQQYTTVVIWDVPDGCTVEEVLHLCVGSTTTNQQADNKQPPPPLSVQYDGSNGNHSWFLVFASERDATIALGAVVQQTIRGMPTHAGIVATPLPPPSLPQSQSIPSSAAPPPAPVYNDQYPQQQQLVYPPWSAPMAQGYAAHPDGRVVLPPHYHYDGVAAMPQQFHPQAAGYALVPPQPGVHYNAAYPMTPYTEPPPTAQQAPGAGHNQHPHYHPMHPAPPHGVDGYHHQHYPLPPHSMLPQYFDQQQQQFLPYNPHAGYVPPPPPQQQHDAATTRPPPHNQSRRRGSYSKSRGRKHNRAGSGGGKPVDQQNADKDNDSNDPNNTGRQQPNDYKRDAPDSKNPGGGTRANETLSSSSFQQSRETNSASPFPSSDGSYKSNGNKNYSGRRSKSKRRQGTKEEVLVSKEEFPALVDSSKTGGRGGKGAHPSKTVLGYAAALKKQPATLPPSGESTSAWATQQHSVVKTPSGQSTSQRMEQHLEQQMSKLKVSSTGEQDVWNGFDDSQVPEEW